MGITSDVWEQTQDLRSKFPDWRPGQAAFNALERTDTEIADLVRGRVFDPFYKDEVLPFWTWLSGWDL